MVCLLLMCQVLNGVVFMVSLMGNCGTFTKPLKDIVTDFQFIYHLGYLVVSMLGLCLHEFFYSLLVSVIGVAVVCHKCQCHG